MSDHCLCSAKRIVLADLEGAPPERGTTAGPKFSQFHAVFLKIKIVCWSPKRIGAPSSWICPWIGQLEHRKQEISCTIYYRIEPIIYLAEFQTPTQARNSNSNRTLTNSHNRTTERWCVLVLLEKTLILSQLSIIHISLHQREAQLNTPLKKLCGWRPVHTFARAFQ